MAEAATLAMTIRTPHAVIFDEAIDGARIPTESGLAGIRPRGEPLVAAVEPGLVVLRSGGALRFAATAGGLVETDRQRCTLYTPYAVVGASEEEMLAALAKIKATPSSEKPSRSSTTCCRTFVPECRSSTGRERRPKPRFGASVRERWRRAATRTRDPAGAAGA